MWLQSERSEKYRKSENLRKHLRRSYRLTVREYKKLIEKSGGKCEICGAEKNLCVDHDHSDGRIRGVLCRKCNIGIGYFDDSIARMSKAIKYLRGRI